jgi:hypothetical protein
MFERFDGGRPDRSAEGSHNVASNEFAVVFESEVACIEKVKIGAGNVAKVCLRALDSEEGIVFAPDDEGFWLFLAEELMPLVIVREVGLVVMEQVELDCVIARPIEEMLVNGIRIGVNAGQIFNAVCVLEDGCVFGEQRSDWSLGFRIAICPEGLHGVESGTDALGIRVAVLDDYALNRIRML